MSRTPSTIREADGVLYVFLREGFEALVDMDDRQHVQGHRWCLLTTKTGHAYAYRREKGKVVLMHRQLTGAMVGQLVDHEDGDGLNNRRKNMRVGTPTQNQANRAADRRNRLGVKGVQLTRGGKYKAYITPAGRKIHLGSFATPEEASAAYTGAAKVLWGEFAKK